MDSEAGRFRGLPLLALAGGALCVGATVYLFFRPTHDLYLLAGFHLVSPSLLLPDNLRPVVASLPTATHAFALSLLTAPFLPSRRQPAEVACLFWACTDSAFEFLQLAPSCPPALVRSGAGLAALTCAYISNGTFAWLDVFSVWLGAAIAYAALAWLVSESEA